MLWGNVKSGFFYVYINHKNFFYEINQKCSNMLSFFFLFFFNKQQSKTSGPKIIKQP
jgi:hypothetical protein